MRATETIYREMLVAYARRRGGQLQEDCDLSVRLWAAADTCPAHINITVDKSGNLMRVSQGQLDSGSFVPTSVTAGEFTSDRHPAGRPVS